MKQIIKDTAVLLIITLIAGLALACVHDITEDPIKNAEEAAKLEAFKAVYPEAASFGDCSVDFSACKPADGVVIGEVKAALDNSGKTLGWVMTLTSPAGYGGDIKIAAGVTLGGTLTAISVISMNETAGLGAKCTGSDFTSQFSGITSDTIISTKSGKDAANEIDAISGATFTTGAVVSAVNAGLSLAYDYLIPSENS